MRHKALIGWLAVGFSLAFLGLAARSEADLGCFRDTTSVATCSIAADCAAVGGTDCTNGFCLCSSGPTSPFCPCTPFAAPALSHSTLTAAALLVFTIGLLGLWRQIAGARRDPS